MRFLFAPSLLLNLAIAATTAPVAVNPEDQALSWVHTAPAFAGRLQSDLPATMFVPIFVSNDDGETKDPVMGIRFDKAALPTEQRQDVVKDLILPTLAASAPTGAVVIAFGLITLYGIRRAIPA